MELPEPKITSSIGAVRDCAAHFMATVVYEGEDASTLGELDEATEGDLSRSLQSREFRPAPFEVYVTRMKGLAPRMLCVGGGPPGKLTTERVRKLATTAGWAARTRGASRLGWLVRPGGVTSSAHARAAADGLSSAALGADRRKTQPRDLAPLEEVVILSSSGEDLAAAVGRGVVDGHATNLARWLSDEPANVLSPARLASLCRELFHTGPVTVEVLDEAAIRALGMGLLLAVGQGSVEPTRMIVLRYRPDTRAHASVLGLVGKGVTFDSGGLSIKPAEGMDRMKHDMSGAAAVIAAMHAIGTLRPATEVIGVVPCVENMPSGGAFRPGDILTSASGRTVEVLNTDAEGRLILGDALWYATQLGATHLVDVATLTGACVVALGHVCSGLFGQPDAWVEAVSRSGAQAGERFWRLPCDDDYQELLKSDYADMTNTGGRAGGAIGAAMFLREFVGDLPWAHLDVAGTAWAEQAKPWQPKGATGVAVRTLIELATAQAWA